MKFKILKGTKSFDQFVELQAEMKRCNDAARKLATKVGVKQWHVAWWSIAGGISAFIFDKKPAGWGNAYTKHEKGAYMPKKNLVANKELLAEIEALPRVDPEVLNKIVKYDVDKCCPGNRKMFHPAFAMRENCVILSFSDYIVKYKGTKDMIEITHTEYNELSKAK